MSHYHPRFYGSSLASIFAVLIVCLFFINDAFATDSEFPGRAIYPDVTIIEIAALKKELDDVMVVDVRSTYEYRTLRIKGAINIPVSSSNFGDNIRKLNAKTNKPIVFYCNGKTCMKSYKAAQQSSIANIKNVRAYDAGIMDWAKQYPDDAVLLGKTLGTPELLIGKSQFKKHLLDTEHFTTKVASGKHIVLDVRDSFQRDALALFPGRERRAYLDQTKKLDRYIRRAKKQGRTLLIYDAAGKQVRWLQYYLEYKRVSNYFFMKGGARAYYSTMTDDFLGKK